MRGRSKEPSAEGSFIFMLINATWPKFSWWCLMPVRSPISARLTNERRGRIDAEK